MIRKNIIIRAGLVAALGFSLQSQVACAQDIHFTQFDAVPMIINPAFTGDFDGQYRAAVIYRNQWQSVTIPYVTMGAGFDIHLLPNLGSGSDNLALGVQLYKDQAGDANLQNFTGLVSLAYHKGLGSNVNRPKQLTVGLQGGYAQESIDLSKLYFADEYQNGTFNQGLSQEYKLGLLNSVHYYMVNAGISWSQKTGDNFSYELGAAANNINQPSESFEKTQNSEVSLAMRYTGELGFVWGLNDRFSLRPVVLYQSQASASEVVVGNEFHLLVGNPDYKNFSTAVFLGGYWRTGDAAMVTAGVEYKSFRIGVSYDYNISSLNTASNGNGGFEMSIVYKAPNLFDFAKHYTVPCDRF